MSARLPSLLALLAVAAALVAGAAWAASVPHGSPAAVKAAFAHGAGAWSVPLAAGGSSKPAAWPDACKLLSVGELKALLPGTTAFRTQGQHGHFLGGGNTPHF